MRVVCFLLVAVSSLPAAIISSAHGGTLAGGTVTANWADGTAQTFVITAIAPATGSGRINQAGFFNFNIDNSTLDNSWSITNNRTSALVGFVINLTSAITAAGTAVFDSAAAPLAPGSDSNVITAYGGTAGVRAVSGGTISSFNFSSQYTGDGGANMFRILQVSLGGSGVAQNAKFMFNADTDLIAGTPIPEGNMWIPTLALLSVGLFRRRRNQ